MFNVASVKNLCWSNGDSCGRFTQALLVNPKESPYSGSMVLWLALWTLNPALRDRISVEPNIFFSKRENYKKLYRKNYLIDLFYCL